MSWAESKLGNICDISIGKTPSRKNLRYWDREKTENNPWLSIADLSAIAGKTIGDSKEYISSDGAKLCKKVKKDTLVMSFKLSIGKLAFLERDLYTNEAIAAFDIKNKETLTPQYLYYYLYSYDWDKETSNDRKLMGKTLNKKKLNEIPIIFPPITVQKQIVEKLDAAFAEIDKVISVTQKNIENADALYNGILIKEFETNLVDPIYKSLSDVSLEFGRGKSKHRPRNAPELYGGDYPFIQTGNVTNSDKLVTHFDKSYNDIGLRQSKIWGKGTLCITIAANIAECAILDFDACFPDSIIGLVADPDQTSNNYVFYLLTYFKKYIQNQSRGFAQQNINMGTFENEKFPFPSSLADQDKLVERLEAAQSYREKLNTTYHGKLDNLIALKSSILNQAFSGELSEVAG